MKALKSLVPYVLIAALMWVMWLCGSNGERLPFVDLDLWLAVFYLAPLLFVLMGAVAGRCMGLPGFYPAWRAVLDGALALVLFLMCHSGLTVRLFGLPSKLGMMSASAAEGGLRAPLVIFAGLLLGRLTLLPRRRAKETAPE